MNDHLVDRENSRDKFIEIMNNYLSKEKETSNSKFRLQLIKESQKFFIKTNDGSYTLNSPDFDGTIETMHNSNGAITESFEKFIKPFKRTFFKNNKRTLKDKNSLKYTDDIAILDICSGLGYNSAALIADFLENTDKKNSSPKLSIDMLEISKETLAAGIIVPTPIESHKIIKKAIESQLINENFLKLYLEEAEIPENISISIHCEDARKTIKNLEDNSYDAIFLDPYSPAMAPELCTVDFFKELKRVIKDNGIIATYTLAAGVRYAFVEAGFYIGEGPVFGRISGGTIASLTSDNIDKDISKDDEKTIALSDAGIPFRDNSNLNSKSFEILNKRKLERKIARHNYKVSSAVQTPIFIGKSVEDEKLKRRILRNLNKVNISDLKSEESSFILSPQEKFLFGKNLKYDFKTTNKYNFKNHKNHQNHLVFKLKSYPYSNFKIPLNIHFKSNSKDRIVEMYKRLKILNDFKT